MGGKVAEYHLGNPEVAANGMVWAGWASPLPAISPSKTSSRRRQWRRRRHLFLSAAWRRRVVGLCGRAETPVAAAAAQKNWG